MSETPTPEELVEEIEYEVEDADVIPNPIDTTLTVSGAAADAKATGDAIAGVFGGAKVNNKTFTNKELTLYGGDIKMSSEEGAQTIEEAFESIQDKDASEIMYDPDNLVSVKDELDSINDALDSEISEDDIDGIIEEVFGESDE